MCILTVRTHFTMEVSLFLFHVMNFITRRVGFIDWWRALSIHMWLKIPIIFRETFTVRIDILRKCVHGFHGWSVHSRRG